MAKQIHNPVEVVLKFTQDGVWTVSGWTQYQVIVTEYPGLTGRPTLLDLTFTSQEKDAIVNFASSVIYPQIATKEGI